MQKVYIAEVEKKTTNNNTTYYNCMIASKTNDIWHPGYNELNIFEDDNNTGYLYRKFKKLLEHKNEWEDSEKPIGIKGSIEEIIIEIKLT